MEIDINDHEGVVRMLIGNQHIGGRIRDVVEFRNAAHYSSITLAFITWMLNKIDDPNNLRDYMDNLNNGLSKVIKDQNELDGTK